MMNDHGNVHIVDSDEEFEALLETAEQSVVAVDFSAEWCGPCKQIAPVFAALSTQYSDMIFLKVDVDKLNATAQKYQVQAMPTFIFFHNGVKVQEFKGANPQTLQQTLQSLSSLSKGGNTTSNATSATTTSSAKFNFFPQESYIYFDTGKVEMIQDKILSINTKFESDKDLAKYALSASEVTQLKKLCGTVKATSQYHASSFSAEEFAAVAKLLQWPHADRFPGLDLLRLLVLHPEAASYYGKSGMVNTAIIPFLQESNVPFAIYLMCLRFIANGFRFESLRKVILSQLNNLLPVMTPLQKHENKNVRVALGTALLNYAVALAENSKEEEKLLPLLLHFISTESDEEVQLRVVVALGTALLPKTQTDLRSHILKNEVHRIEGMKAATAKVEQAKKELLMIIRNEVPTSTSPSHLFPSAPPTVPPVASNPMSPPFGLGNLGGAPGMPQINPELFSRIMSNPVLFQALQNPAIMAKLQQLMSDPSRISEFQSDPEFVQLMQLMSSIMQ